MLWQLLCICLVRYRFMPMQSEKASKMSDISLIPLLVQEKIVRRLEVRQKPLVHLT